MAPPAEQARVPTGDSAGQIRVEIAWWELNGVRRQDLRMPIGATVLQAIQAAQTLGLLPPEIALRSVAAVYGRLRGPEHVLNDGDRVELTGPLLVDPKLARERRVAHRRAAARDGKWRPLGR